MKGLEAIEAQRRRKGWGSRSPSPSRRTMREVTKYRRGRVVVSDAVDRPLEEVEPWRGGRWTRRREELDEDHSEKLSAPITPAVFVSRKQ